ncbi:transketolase family protein [Candidatus Beckwithbacteria bacterium]|nr:transketolase family protein [Candidatus Beckwithbacteria bacterium]
MNVQNKQSTRDGYGQGLLELAKTDVNIVALTADLAESTRVLQIAKTLPNQFVECGVAEQNMMGVAAGLALAGKTPFVNSFAVFNPGRNWDQLRVSVCYSNLGVKIAGHHSGLSNGGDGATHQGLEDIAITACLPNLTIISPCDFNEAKNCVAAAANYPGPVYIRLSKSEIVAITDPNQEFVIGRGECLQLGDKLTVITTGRLVSDCLELARQHSEVGIELLKLSTIRPLDEELILSSAAKTKKVLVVEDHQITGGLGSLICQLLSQKLPVPTTCHGIYNRFTESGSEPDLLAKYQLDQTGIWQKISQIL